MSDYWKERAEAVEAENKRLRSCLEETEEMKRDWKARAEAMEKVVDAASRFYDNSTRYDKELDDALAALKATR